MESKIIWFTGLSGSGKTTLSKLVSKQIEKKKFKIKIIDGDIFRKKNKTFKFNKTSIIKNNKALINYVNKIKFNYDYILVSAISPLKQTRIIAYKKFKENYYEIYTKCSLKKLVSRDTKGLYAKAKKKLIKDLIGFNSRIKYEETEYKKIIINTSKEKIRQSVNKILKKICN